MILITPHGFVNMQILLFATIQVIHSNKQGFKTKRAELSEMSKIPTPAEFDKYYNL